MNNIYSIHDEVEAIRDLFNNKDVNFFEENEKAAKKYIYECLYGSLKEYAIDYLTSGIGLYGPCPDEVIQIMLCKISWACNVMERKTTDQVKDTIVSFLEGNKGEQAFVYPYEIIVNEVLKQVKNLISINNFEEKIKDLEAKIIRNFIAE